MNKLTKIISVLIVIAVLMSSICINSYAAVSTPTIKNTGTRDEICTSLSSMASSYYTADYSYDVLSEKSNTALLTSLRDLMKNTHKNTSSYANCRDLPIYTDCRGSDGKIVLLYSSVGVTQNEWIGSGSVGWNREHVWPQSLGGFGTSGAGADLHHVRPSDSKINGTRGNLPYGNVENGTQANGTSIVSNISGGEYGGGYFEPLDNVKGDVARICLYVYARYGGEISECSNITTVFQSVDVLLDWCELDPVDTWEMSRNDVVGSIQGNRNVFIDYPEYAWILFDKEVPNDMATPSGEAKQPSQDNDSNEGNTPETNTPETNTPEPSVPETNIPEINTPETDAPTTDAPTTDAPATDAPKTDENDNKNDDKSDEKADSDDGEADSGCGSTIALSAICVVGIIGIVTTVKKKKD